MIFNNLTDVLDRKMNYFILLFIPFCGAMMMMRPNPVVYEVLDTIRNQAPLINNDRNKNCQIENLILFCQGMNFNNSPRKEYYFYFKYHFNTWQYMKPVVHLINDCLYANITHITQYELRFKIPQL